MTYQVNQRITPYQQQPPMGLGADSVDSDKIKQGVNNSPVTKATQHDNPALLLGVMVPTMAGTAWGMSKFNTACKGDYKSSLIGKIGAWGDEVGSSKVFQNPVVEGMGKAYSRVKSFLNEKIINKNKVLYAMFNTRSQPRHKMVLTMAGSIETELASSAATTLDEYFKHGGELSIKETLKDGSSVVRKLEKEEIEEITKYSHKPENVEKIINICEQKGLTDCHKVEKVGKIPWSKKLFGKEKYISEMLGSFGKKVLGKEVYFSEIANKLNAARGSRNVLQKTWFGKVLPRQVLRVLEGLTNLNTGGGAIAILMGSYIIADSIVKSIKAPKDEKGKTFAENMIYNLGWYLTMPLGLKAMHSIGGLQYIGMTKEQVEEYRARVEKLNKNGQNGDIPKAEYDKEVKELNEMLKGDTKIVKGEGIVKNGVKRLKNLIYRPLKFVGKLFTAGLESIRAYIPKNATKSQKFFKNLGFNLKNWGFGSPLRFITFMFLIAPFLGKLAAKCSHIVFGRPTHSVLDEGKEEKKAKEEQQHPTPVMPRTPAELQAQQAQQTQQSMQPLQQNMNMANNQTNSMQKENMIDMYNKTNSTQKTMIPPQEPVRRYIPSPEGVKVQPEPTQQSSDDKVNAALLKADNAEKRANRFIH